MNTKYAFISQPMNGLSDKEILDTLMKADDAVRKAGYESISSFFKPEDKEKHKETITNVAGANAVNESVGYLGRSIILLSTCSAAYFCKGWENARGCVIEHEICEKYGIKILSD